MSAPQVVRRLRALLRRAQPGPQDLARASRRPLLGHAIGTNLQDEMHPRATFLKPVTAVVVVTIIVVVGPDGVSLYARSLLVDCMP